MKLVYSGLGCRESTFTVGMFSFPQLTSKEQAVKIIKVSFIRAGTNSTFNCTALNSFVVIDGFLLTLPPVLYHLIAQDSKC